MSHVSAFCHCLSCGYKTSKQMDNSKRHVVLDYDFEQVV